MKRTFALFVGLVFALLCQLALAAPAVVSEVAGTAQAIPGAGAARTLRKGDDVNQGETVVTGDNSNVVLRFEDGQIVALGARSRLAVNSYVYDKTDAAKSNVLLSLLDGGMRAITGLIGRRTPQQVAYRAGNATIGIRGTDVTIATAGGEVAVTVADGLISFAFAGKTVSIPAGEGARTLPNGQIQTASAAQIIAAIKAEGGPAAAAIAAALSTVDNQTVRDAVRDAVQQSQQPPPSGPVSGPIGTPGTTGTTGTTGGAGGGSASPR